MYFRVVFRLSPVGLCRAAVWGPASLTDEYEVRTSPQRCGNTATGPRRQDDVVIARRLKSLDHRGQRLGFHHSQIGEKAVHVRLSAVVLGDKGNVGVFSRKMPAQ